MRDLDRLIEHLLGKVALRGVRGIHKSDLHALITRFYESNSQGHISATGPTPLEGPLVDDAFCNAVWTWLSASTETLVEKREKRSQQGHGRKRATLSTSKRSGAPPAKRQKTDALAATEGNGSDANNDDGHAVEIPHDASPHQSDATTQQSPTAAEASTGSRQSVEEDWMLASEHRMWHALTGHSKDSSRVPPLSFQLLSLIAAREIDGILQPELVSESNQDKRSVPKRTDMLARDGYIDKRAYYTRGMRTSLCTLKSFMSADKPQRVESEVNPTTIFPGNKTVDMGKFLTFIMHMVKEADIIPLEELRGRFGTIGKSWEGRSMRRQLQSMARLGCIRLVKARGLVGERMTIMCNCIQFVRDITEAEYKTHIHPWKRIEAAKDEDDPDVDIDEDGQLDVDDDIAEEEYIQGDTDANVSLEGSREVLKIAWDPDQHLPNLIYDLIEEAGVDGLSTSELVEKIGMYWKRPVEHLLAILTDHWETTQPPALSHLALVRDTSVQDKAIHYQYRTYNDFRKVAEAGEVSTSIIEGYEQSRRKGLQKDSHSSQQGAWGFPDPPDLLKHKQDGCLTAAEIRQSFKKKRPTFLPMNESLVSRLSRKSRSKVARSMVPFHHLQKSRTSLSTVKSRGHKNNTHLTLDGSTEPQADLSGVETSPQSHRVQSTTQQVQLSPLPRREPSASPIVQARNEKQTARPRINRNTKAWRVFEARTRQMAERSALLEISPDRPVSESSDRPSKKIKTHHTPAQHDDDYDEMIESGMPPNPYETATTSRTEPSLKRPVNDTDELPSAKRLRGTRDLQTETTELAEENPPAGVDPERVDQIHEELLEMKRPGAYVNPPARTIFGRGRPSIYSLKFVIKSDRLYDIPWFGSRPTLLSEDSLVQVEPGQMKEVQKALVSPQPTLNIDSRDVDIAILRARGENLPQTRSASPEFGTSNTALNGVSRAICEDTSAAESVRTTPEVSTLEQPFTPTREPPRVFKPPTSRPSRSNRQAKAGITLKEGSIARQRTERIMNIIDSAGGIFPGNSEIYYPYITMLKKGDPNPTIDVQTVLRSLQNLVKTGRLRKMTFAFRTRQGTTTTRSMVALPSVDSQSQQVKDLQAKIIEYHPGNYFPESVEVDPKVRIRREDDRPPLKDFSEDETLSVSRYLIPKYAVIDEQRRVNRELKYIAREWAEIERLEADVTEDQAAMQGAWSLSKPQPSKGPLYDEDFLTHSWQLPTSESLLKHTILHTAARDPAPPSTWYLKELERIKALEANVDDGQFAMQFEMQLSRYDFDPTAVDKNDAVGVQKPFDTNTLAPIFRSIPSKNVEIGSLEAPCTSVLSNNDLKGPTLEQKVFSQRYTTPRQRFDAPTGTYSTHLSSIVPTCRVLPSIRPQIQAVRDFERDNPTSLQDILTRQAGVADSYSGARVGRPQTFYQQIDQVRNWEHEQTELFTSNKELTEARFISISVPKNVATQLDKDVRTTHKSWTQGYRQGSKKGTYARLNTAKRLKNVENNEPTTRGPKLVNFLDEAELDRLCLIIVVVRTLGGGSSLSIDWDIVTTVFDATRAKIIKPSRWPFILHQRKAFIERLQENFWSTFPNAYATSEVPEIDDNDIGAYDWHAVINWAEREVLHSSKALPTVGPTLKDLNDLGPDMEVTVVPQTTYKPSLDPFVRSITIHAKVENLVRQPYTVPFHPTRLSPQQDDTNTDTALALAKNIVRTTVVTPHTQYEPASAGPKLDPFPNALLRKAIDTLKWSRTITPHKADRVTKGRNYRTSNPFNSIFTRHSINLQTLKRAAAHKLTLDRIFIDEGKTSMDFSPESQNGDVLLIFSLLAAGQLKPAVHMPPLDTSPHVPDTDKAKETENDPPDLLSHFGFSTHGNGYKTAQISRAKFRYPLSISLTDTYAPGLALPFLVETTAAHPPPGPDFPASIPNATSALANVRKIPLWHDIHGAFLPDIWEGLIRAIICALVLREGADAAKLVQVLYVASLEVWEVEIVLDWIGERGYASREGGWWRVSQGWWGVFGVDEGEGGEEVVNTVEAKGKGKAKAKATAKTKADSKGKGKKAVQKQGHGVEDDAGDEELGVDEGGREDDAGDGEDDGEEEAQPGAAEEIGTMDDAA
ncbi:MAG: hypothetical protein M1828_000180 [Chrysothrix sp. TS-e1954]|nr:MAG: hypothetical protein M1828_000180 [Chrysothrix sp. TS-e1954]